MLRGPFSLISILSSQRRCPRARWSGDFKSKIVFKNVRLKLFSIYFVFSVSECPMHLGEQIKQHV